MRYVSDDFLRRFDERLESLVKATGEGPAPSLEMTPAVGGSGTTQYRAQVGELVIVVSVVVLGGSLVLGGSFVVLWLAQDIIVKALQFVLPPWSPFSLS